VAAVLIRKGSTMGNSNRRKKKTLFDGKTRCREKFVMRA